MKINHLDLSYKVWVINCKYGGDGYMRKILNPHAKINKEILDRYLEMQDVLSLSAVVSDAQERNNVLRHDIVTRSVNRRIIGPALTVKLTAGDMVDCLDIFEIVERGDIVAIDAFGECETSIWGGLMSGLCRAAGVVGAVIDGSARDTDEARLLDFPIYSKSVSPRASHTAYSGRKEPIEINTTIVCGGVIVKPGDLVVADEIGITIVPSEDLEDVYVRAKEQAEKEKATREEILRGASVQELLQKFGRL
jgi:3-hexulose-6-phosphate synthase/6-phospho-3-hexuloisomerase